MLPQENRLRKEKDIEKVFKTGKSVFDPVCGFKFLPNNLPVSRFAFMVGTKISKSAVKRNRLRRQIREIIHLNLKNIKTGLDFTFIVRPGAKEADYKGLEDIIVHGLKKARLL
ncbi:MAG: ribonuclease P protein component [Patescibacteria group bacterium]|jgi:ribonuclease P protein component